MLQWDHANSAIVSADSREDLSFDPRDSAALRSEVRSDAGDRERSVAAPARDRVARQRVYELHVRGFTLMHPEVAPELRGTLAGSGRPRAAYLKDLGVTSIELLPIHAFVDDHYLKQRGPGIIGAINPELFRPELRYLQAGDPHEARQFVRAAHEVGLE